MAIPFLSDISGQGATFAGNLTIQKDDPTITLYNNGGANTDPNGTIIFSESNNVQNFDINYNGASDRLEFRGRVGNSDNTDLVLINRDLTTTLQVLGGATFAGNALFAANLNVGYALDNTQNAQVAFKKNENINVDATSRNVFIDYNISGTTAQTGDRNYDAVTIDLDSSATGGNTTNETRISGIKCLVTDTGDSNDIYGGNFDVRATKSVANDKIAVVYGVYAAARAGHTAGEIGNAYGGYFQALSDDVSSGTNMTSLTGVRGLVTNTADSGKIVNNAYGGYFKVDQVASSNNSVFTNVDGVYGEVEIDDGDVTISSARAVRGLIDSNAGTITNAYQFYGITSAAGTITNNWGLYSTGAAKNYLDGTLQLGSYSAGTLVTDASGNITVSSGGGAGGPYLPLAGGTMTGNLQAPKFIAAQGTTYANGYQLTRTGHDTYRICLGNSEGLRIVNETDSNREELGFDGAGNATFAGTVDMTGLTVNSVNQHNEGRYTAANYYVSFNRTSSSDQYFKIITNGGIPKRIRLNITSGGDNTNTLDTYFISQSGYDMQTHIHRLPGSRYNTSKLVSVLSINPSAATQEVWIKLLGMSSGTGTTTIAANVPVSTSSAILATATTTKPTLSTGDCELDISTDDRNNYTTMSSGGSKLGGKLYVGSDSTFSGSVTINSNSFSLNGTAPIMTVNSSNNASGFRINVTGLDADGDDLFRAQDSGATRFTIKRDGDVIIEGNLTVSGTTTTLNTQTVEVEDNILQLNTTQGSPDTATAATSGVSIYRGDGVTQASLIFDDADDTWDLTNNLKIAGSLNVGPGPSRFTDQQNAGSRLELYNDRQDAGNVEVFRIAAYNAAEVTGVHFYRGSGGSSGYTKIFAKKNNTSSLEEVVQFGTNDALTTTFAGAITTTGTLTVNSGHVNLDAGMSLSWDNTHERIEQSDGHLEFFINNGEAMTLDTDGLGIGTTDPTSRLSLSGQQSLLDLTRATSGDAKFFVSADSARLYFSHTDIQSTNLILKLDASDESATFAGDITVTGGDITIGTDSIAGNINSVGDVLALNVDSNTGGGAGANIQLKTAGTAQLTVTSSSATFAGNVELKSDAGNATKHLRIWNQGTAANDDAVLSFTTQSSRTYSIGTHRDSGAFLLTNADASVASGELLTIDNSGNATFTGYVAATQFRPTNIVTNKVVKFNGTQLDDSIITDDGSTVSVAGEVNMASGKITSDGSAAAGAYLELKHANNNSTDVCATINLTNNAGGYAAIVGGTTGANNSGYIQFKTDNAGTQSTVLTLNHDNKSVFNGNVEITGDTASPHSDNAFLVLRGSDGSNAFRVQNSGEVVVQNNYLYAAGAGTSLYVQAGAVIRGDISNDGGDVRVADNLVVTGNLTVDGTTTTLNTQTVEVEDNILQLNTTQGSPDTATAATSGISIYRGDGVTQASFIFDDADDTWDLTNNLKVAGTSFLDGLVTIDHNLNIQNNGVIKIAGTEVISAARAINSASITALAKGVQLGSSGYYINSTFKDTADNVGVFLAHNDTANGVGAIAGINQLAFLTYGSAWTQALLLDSSQNATFAGNVKIKNALIDNASVTSATATTVVASVAHATYNAAFFDFVIKNGTNVRAGTVYACHNGASTPLVEFAETSTVDLGDTSDVTLNVVISGANMVLQATTTSSTWTIKSLIRGI